MFFRYNVFPSSYSDAYFQYKFKRAVVFFAHTKNVYNVHFRTSKRVYWVFLNVSFKNFFQNPYPIIVFVYLFFFNLDLINFILHK